MRVIRGNIFKWGIVSSGKFDDVSINFDTWPEIQLAAS